MTDHFHPSRDPFLSKQVLNNISEKDQLHVCHVKSSLSGQTRGSAIMVRIKTTVLEAHVPEIHEDVRQ